MADRFPLIVDSSAEQLQELAVGDNLNLASSGLINADNVQTSGLSVGVMTATSFIGDGSQLTNLPAAGSSTELTASGTLSNGSKVIVNTDGTVSVVAQTETTGSGVGSETVFNSDSTPWVSATYDSTNNKVVIAYEDNGTGKAIVGTVSGNSISFGSPTTFASSTLQYPSLVHDSANNKVVLSWSDGGNSWYATSVVGTISGTSISFGTPVVFLSGQPGPISSIFDPNNSKVVIAYKDAPPGHGKAIVGTVSGTSISFGSAVTFESAQIEGPSAVYDPNNQKVVIGYCDNGNSTNGTAIVGTVSGNSISFGTPVVFKSGNNQYIDQVSLVYDPNNQKVVFAYRDGTNSSRGTAIVGTVSGTSISFGSPTVFNSNGNTHGIQLVYDSSNQKVVIAYRDGGNSFYGTAIVGTVSGTSISFDTPFVFNSGSTGIVTLTYDSTNNKVVIAYTDHGNNSYGTAVVFTTAGASIPQLGSATVFESATIGDTSVVYDSANQKVVIVYQDQGNSNYGTAIVGTVSGTSISFGTPVVFLTAKIGFHEATYDSTNSKIVIAYQNFGNSQYGTAIVGTVSGTSISFGSPTVFQSSITEYIGATYDSSNQKIVISYADSTGLNYGKAVVGTVSGNSISFGSPTTFVSDQAVVNTPIYDSANQKVVIAYRTGGTNYGTAIVGTVSGTSISFGSPSTFSPASATTIISAAYDSSNQKVVIAYRDPANSNYGTAIVGTVSGTSISFGSPTVFNSNGNTFYITATFDSTNQKILITYTDYVNSSKGTVIEGTVSGTSISFGSPTVFESGQSYYIKSTYDSSNDKVVIAYSDLDDSNYGKSVVFTPRTMGTNLTAENFIGISDGAYTNGQTATVQLIGSVDDAQSSLTPGQKYYVQDNGTLAESGSVLAGTAVAATKLLIKK